ncbi:MAG: leucine-rich repeat protein [Oscillospiraceae bacterium]|nr:leucine-rich repeat protein [Oscillospiraceae bacterium]
MRKNKKAGARIKRILSALTAAAMLLAAAPVFADDADSSDNPAEEVVVLEEDASEEEVVLLGAEEGNIVSLSAVISGNCGDSATYTLELNSDNTTYTLTISGSGAMTDTYTGATDVPWSSYRSSITNISIASGITTIGQYVFNHCAITSIDIPSTVTTIGTNAFNSCTSLTSVTMPSGVTTIKNYAFNGCSALTSITIPDTVTSMGVQVFRNCTALTDVTLGSGITSISNYTFSGCTALASITIPSNIISIGQNAFEGCTALTSIVIPNSVTSIAQYAFYNCTALTTVTIGTGLVTLQSTSFSGCTALTTVYVLQSASTSSTLKTNLTTNKNTYLLTGATVYFLAENVQLSLVPVYDDSSTPAQIYGQYKLTISGLDSDGNAGIIYRFSSAQMKFAFDETDGQGTTYDITKIGALSIDANTAGYIAMIYKGNGEYGFYANPANNNEDTITSHEIVLGDVNIAGVGSYSLNIDTANYINEAHASYLKDGIVYDFYYNATASKTTNTGVLFLAATGETGPIPATGTITLTTIPLTVKVMFPNEISSATTTYTAMSLTYNNLSLTEAKTIAIGNNSSTTMSLGDINYNSSTWKGYTFTIDIPAGYTTSLVFAGDGYRTCNTSVTPDSDATSASVTVWNNVMDEAQTVITVGDTPDTASATKVTFLAGDIVDDGEINLYDLSAVTSYFGKEIGDTETKYIQYDLNRDGVIDSVDIAMVLISWGN